MSGFAFDAATNAATGIKWLGYGAAAAIVLPRAGRAAIGESYKLGSKAAEYFQNVNLAIQLNVQGEKHLILAKHHLVRDLKLALACASVGAVGHVIQNSLSSSIDNVNQPPDNELSEKTRISKYICKLKSPFEKAEEKVCNLFDQAKEVLAETKNKCEEGFCWVKDKAFTVLAPNQIHPTVENSTTIIYNETSSSTSNQDQCLSSHIHNATFSKLFEDSLDLQSLPAFSATRGTTIPSSQFDYQKYPLIFNSSNNLNPPLLSQDLTDLSQATGQFVKNEINDFKNLGHVVGQIARDGVDGVTDVVQITGKLVQDGAHIVKEAAGEAAEELAKVIATELETCRNDLGNAVFQTSELQREMQKKVGDFCGNTIIKATQKFNTGSQNAIEDFGRFDKCLDSHPYLASTFSAGLISAGAIVMYTFQKIMGKIR